MTNQKPNSLIFKYEGDFEGLDTVTVLQTQLNFIAVLSEIKTNVYPELKINFKISGTEKGSLDINHIIEFSQVAGLFALEHKDYLKGLFDIFKDLVKLKSFLRGEKAATIDKINDGKMVTVINVNGDNNVFHADAIKIYQGNHIVNNALASSGKYLSDTPEITSVEVSSDDSSSKKLVIPREEFDDLRSDNTYLSTDKTSKMLMNQNLFVKDPNLFPVEGRMWNWKFLYKGNTITAEIKDDSLRHMINEGKKFGQGDCIVADIVAHYKFNKGLNTYELSGKYEITAIRSITDRSENGKLKFDD